MALWENGFEKTNKAIWKEDWNSYNAQVVIRYTTKNFKNRKGNAKEGVAIGGFHISGSPSMADVADKIQNIVAGVLNRRGKLQFRSKFTGRFTTMGNDSFLEIDNPSMIEVTFNDEIHTPASSGEAVYGGSKLSNYELAKVHADGDEHLPVRDMFREMQQFVDSDSFKNELVQYIAHNKEIREVSKSGEGKLSKYKIHIDWEGLMDFCVGRITEAINDTSFYSYFKPITERAKEGRRSAGLSDSPPMYATHQLARSLVGTVSDIPF